MAQPQANVSLTAPGFAGLNTQDSPLDMDISFASVANNCVIDNFGRIASRRGFNYVTENPAILNGNPIVSIEEFVTSDDQRFLFACGDNQIFIQATTGSPLNLTALTLPRAPTADNWKMVGFNDKCYFVQANHQPLVFDPAVSTVALQDWAEYPAETAGNNWPNECHAAFGRLWVTDYDNDKTSVSWSGLLNGENWTSLGYGALQTEEYWPSGFDRIRALAAHNNFMAIMGERNILVYTTTADVLSTLSLSDTIEGIGCIARDSVVPTGVDFMFIDATGVRSLMRTIQEKSVPIGDISRNVRNDFQLALRFEQQDDIKAVFHVEDSFYCTFLPSNPLTYVFDTWNPLQGGAARATTWTNIRPRCATRTLDRQTYFGGSGGVYLYEGAQDVTFDGVEDQTEAIAFEYYTHPIDFGQPANLIFPKQVDVVLFGGLQGDLNLNWGYDYQQPDKRIPREINTQGALALWNTEAEWDNGYEWTSGENLQELRYNIWGSGRNVKIGFDATILGSTISLQQIDIQALQGRLL